MFTCGRVSFALEVAIDSSPRTEYPEFGRSSVPVCIPTFDNYDAASSVRNVRDFFTFRVGDRLGSQGEVVIREALSALDRYSQSPITRYLRLPI